MQFNYSAWLLDMRKAVESLGNKNGLKYPGNPNEEADAAMVEYSKAAIIRDAATKRYEVARKRLTRMLELDKVSPGARNSIARQSATGIVLYSSYDNPATIDATALTSMLVKEFDVTVEEATQLVDSCRTKRPGGYVKMLVTLNDMKDNSNA